jgi:hypothetical protein
LRHLIVVTAGVGLLLGGSAACGSSGTPSASSAAGSPGATGATTGSVSGAGASGDLGGTTTGVPAASAGAATSGAPEATGAVTSGAQGTTGAPETGTANGSGTSGASAEAGPSTDGDAAMAGCAPGAIFCDGFEEYPPLPAFDSMGNLRDFIPTGSTTPTWLGYHFHGPPYVDASMPFAGKQEYHLNTETGHPAAADIIKESPDGVDIWPAAHYGRVMFYIKAVPPKGPFALISESGLLPGGTMNESQYTLGSADGKLAWIYTQRVRPYKNSASTPKMRLGGDWETPAQKPTTMCTAEATTETLTAGKWTCIEWMIDRTKPELHIWLDGTPQTEVDVTGSAGTCSAGTAATWTGPEHFTELDLGFEMWGSDGGPGAWEAWYDEFAIGTQRLGCPTN